MKAIALKRNKYEIWKRGLAWACAVIMTVAFITGFSDTGVLKAQAAEMTDEEICQAARELFDQLLNCAVSDPDNFASLYRGTSEEAIQGDLDFFNDLYSEHYSKESFFIIARADPYYYIQRCCYTVAGTHPNTHLVSSAGQFVMSYRDSEWKMDFSEEATNAINTDETFISIYPEGALDADAAGRNVTIFGGYPYLYLNDTAVFEGAYDSQLAYLWQNEDGSVDAVIGLANGTSGAIYVKSITLTVTDDTLGTVIDQTVSCGEMINAGYNKTVTLHFEPSQVMTGTSEWTSMSSHVHTTY